MSRTPIRCPQCKTPLAVREQHGQITVILTALAAQQLIEHGTRLVCKCGEKRVVWLTPKQREEAA